MTETDREFMSWRDSYEIRIPPIDRQHRRILELINELHRAVGSVDRTETIAAALRAMVTYTREHFVDEEALMQRLGFEGLGSQRQEHAAFVEKVTGYLIRLKSGADLAPQELLAFLREWWENHICGSDREIGPAYAARKTAVANR